MRYRDVFGQLFFSQTPQLMIGKHKEGLFHEVERLSMYDLKELCDESGQSIDISVRKLRKLLHSILAFILAREADQTILVCENGQLAAYACDSLAERFDSSVDGYL